MVQVAEPGAEPPEGDPRLNPTSRKRSETLRLRSGQAAGHPSGSSLVKRKLLYAAGGWILISTMSVSLIFTGPSSPDK